ncbi:MAG: hypothetical protein OEX22_10400 [Cyclobacteriaceae bacterium]|nr:hypothetical protein [Cyclobacteriaceae bacterium]
MKIVSIIICLIASISNSWSQCQRSEEILFGNYPYVDVEMAENIHWYSFNFSSTSLIGSQYFTNPYDIVQNIMPWWIKHLTKDSGDGKGKHILKNKATIDEIEYAKSQVGEISEPMSIVYEAPGPKLLSVDSIRSIIKNYPNSSLDGIGTALIVEQFHGYSKCGTVTFVVFNIKSKELIFAKRYRSAGGGVGIKSYWYDPLGHTASWVKAQIEKKSINEISK